LTRKSLLKSILIIFITGLLGVFITGPRGAECAEKRLSIIVPLTIALIFFILFSAFNSLKYAALIILNLPFALIGGIVGLFVSSQYLSVPASVGFIALFGVAVLNSVVLVSYINKLRERASASRRP